MPSTRKQMAVPFTGKDRPSDAAEFAHPDICIGLTTLSYRYCGLRIEDVRLILDQLKSNLRDEPGPIESRTSKRLFGQWLKNGIASWNKKHAGSLINPKDGPQSKKITKKLMTDFLPLELFQPSDDLEVKRLWEILYTLPSVVRHHLLVNVFPIVLVEQRNKCSASGQDLGSEIIFKTRIGFSGTPSDLLPQDLQPCKFEAGSEGKIISTLCSPTYVDINRLNDWTVQKVLDSIATASPPFNTLIDVGALITGLTNEEVARYLLEIGLPGMDACVFLDQKDRQMVVIRGSRGAPVELSVVGVPKNRRFTFYDAVHTTGIDIKQAPTARAALTLSKDTTIRDYAQGAWRMRGLGKGQTITLFIIDEVMKLVYDTLGIKKSSQSHSNATSPKGTQAMLCDTLGWLALNEMRMAQMQNSKLLEQSLVQTFRLPAFKTLTNSYATLAQQDVSNGKSSYFDCCWALSDEDYITFKENSGCRLQDHTPFMLMNGKIDYKFLHKRTDAQRSEELIEGKKTYTKMYVSVRFNGGDSRPMILSIDGKEVQNPFMQQTTGDWWNVKLATWFKYGPFDFNPTALVNRNGDYVHTIAIALEDPANRKIGPTGLYIRVHEEEYPSEIGADPCKSDNCSAFDIESAGLNKADLVEMGARVFQYRVGPDKNRDTYESYLRNILAFRDSRNNCRIAGDIRNLGRPVPIEFNFGSPQLLVGYSLHVYGKDPKLKAGAPVTWKVQVNLGDGNGEGCWHDIDYRGKQNGERNMSVDEYNAKESDNDFVGIPHKVIEELDVSIKQFTFLIQPIESSESNNAGVSRVRFIIDNIHDNSKTNEYYLSGISFYVEEMPSKATPNYSKDPALTSNSALFLEEVNNDLIGTVPKKVSQKNNMKNYIELNKEKIVPGQQKQMDAILSQFLDVSDDNGSAGLDGELTREQEQEMELQLEQEAEQEEQQEVCDMLTLQYLYGLVCLVIFCLLWCGVSMSSTLYASPSCLHLLTDLLLHQSIYLLFSLLAQVQYVVDYSMNSMWLIESLKGKDQGKRGEKVEYFDYLVDPNRSNENLQFNWQRVCLNRSGVNEAFLDYSTIKQTLELTSKEIEAFDLFSSFLYMKKGLAEAKIGMKEQTMGTLVEPFERLVHSLRSYATSTIVSPLKCCPANVGLTENLVKSNWLGLGERVINNVNILLEWYDKPTADAPDHEKYLRTVAISLAEAATLRKFLHQQLHLSPEKARKSNLLGIKFALRLR